ncbi:MAG: hypothetical protein SGI71_13570 [Verrucomicrobiota bacterium]|nr:hypothetical protein [Verrucomicrobiota bacterium]
MKFLRITQNEKTELIINLESLVAVQVTGPFGYLMMEDQSEKLMVPVTELERLKVFFPENQFPRIPESPSKYYMVNLQKISQIQVTTGMSYLHLQGLKERIMLKPEVWSEISIHFPAQ